MTTTETAATTHDAGGILSRRYIRITAGAFVLVFLAAFENLAVTTAMPAVAADLDGQALYALAFAGTLAASMVGMVGAGDWADRRGPRVPLFAAVALFGLGLLLAGLAPSMGVFVIARVIQGVGSGALTVTLYVIVAQAFPARLHPAVFAAFAAAWVIPSLVGPAIAGVVTQLWSWHWVFLGVLIVELIAVAVLVPAVRGRLRTEAAVVTGSAKRRLAWAGLTAVGVLAVSLLPDVGVVGQVLVIVPAAVALFAVRPLLPRRTFLAARGLPAVILARMLLGAAFVGSQVYVPLLLTRDHGYSLAAAGLSLTVAGVAWSVASTVQGRLGERLASPVAVRLGAGAVAAGLVASAVVAITGGSPLLVMLAWILAGSGMGLASPRLSVLTLAAAAPDEQGAASAAMAIADAFGGALALAMTGILFAAVSGSTGFAAVWLAGAVVAAAAVATVARFVVRGARGRE